MKYFEKKLNDRRKRTYDVLSQFDKDLAEIIISPQIGCGGKANKMNLNKVNNVFIRSAIVI